jgi:hypothetical protein
VAGAEDKTAKLLAALWVKNLPLVEERLSVLEHAAGTAAGGHLAEPLRAEAAGAAHKLAGSLGMYGYDEGTRIARELEVLLNGANPDAARLSVLTVALRAAILPPA